MLLDRSQKLVVNTTRWLPFRKSQSQRGPRSEVCASVLVATQRPSGEQAHAVTALSCSRKPTCFLDRKSQNRTILSFPAEYAVFPSGKKPAAKTPLEWYPRITPDSPWHCFQR